MLKVLYFLTPERRCVPFPLTHRTPRRFATHTPLPNLRQVLECGGWRGTGLTPLSTGTYARCGWLDVEGSILPHTRKAVCALPPHPPHSKTLRDSHAAPEPPSGLGVRWLAGNGADTAFDRNLRSMWVVGC